MARVRLWLFVLLMAVVGVAEAQVVPLRNWPAPPTWTPQVSGTKGLMADVSNPLPFIPVDPCRIADTRGNGFTGQYGTPALSANTSRTFTIRGQCSVSSAARAVSLNLTIVNETSAGNLIAWAAGGSQPNVSNINFSAGTGALANGSIVPLRASDGAMTVILNATAGNTVDLIIDVNGYYYDASLSSPTLNTNEYFAITASRAGGGAVVGSNSGSGAGTFGGDFSTSSTGAGSAGVRGVSSATGASGVLYGVLGQSSSTSLDAAGVRGIDGTGAPTGATSFPVAGLRGESTSAVGVLGMSQAAGVRGSLLNTSGTTLAEGVLGYTASGSNYGVYSTGDIYAVGNLSATGTKAFVMPHPTDPSQVIRYVALEGPEVGTYARGRARLQNHMAIVDLPDSFRLVTEEDGITVQITPIGAPLNVWIQSFSPDQLVVRGSRDIDFFYTVNGVRKGFAGYQAISGGTEFVPESADARIPAGLSEEAKRRLIANGTYNEDGTVNLDTASRMGWTKLWAQRGRPTTR
jgi:hypothetical protein